MRRLLIAAVLVLTGAAFVAAQTPEEFLGRARTAYDQGDYAVSVQNYQALLAQGLESPELYYNLGNAEFKAGHLGRAIAGYRRALKRAPGDEDIRYNLEYARSFVRQPADRSSLLARTIGNLVTLWSGQALAGAALFLYLVLAGLGAGLILARGHAPVLRWAAAAVGVLFVLAAGWASARILLERNHRWGVVVAARAEARNGPSDEYQVGFIVPEGREVRVLGREGEWVAIGLQQEGVKGWIRGAEILADE